MDDQASVDDLSIGQHRHSLVEDMRKSNQSPIKGYPTSAKSSHKLKTQTHKRELERLYTDQDN